MAIVDFYRVEERSQRVVSALLAGLLFYWILGCLLLVQLTYAAVGALFTSGASLWIKPALAAVVVLLAVCFALSHYAWATRSVITRTLRLFEAAPLERGDPYHTLFRNTVDEIRIATGNRIPIRCVVVPCGSLNGFSLRDPHGNAIVGLTEGLLARLKRNEVQAVVAQLTGQVISKEALISTVTYSLFGSLEEFVDRMLDSTKRDPLHRDTQPLAGFMPILLMAKAFLRFGSFLNMALSRERVFRSDALAVELTRDPMGLAAALRRMSYGWRGSGTFGTATESVLFAPPGRGKHDRRMGFFAFLFRAQPPVEERLRRVLAMAGKSLAQVDELLKKPAAQRAVASDSRPSTDVLWKAFFHGSWQGPFTLAALAAMPELAPATFVCRMGASDIIPAGDDDILRRELFGKAHPHGKCPRCGGLLKEIRYEGVAVLTCGSCGGHLVPNDAVQRILVRTIFPMTKELKESTAKWKEAHRVRPKIERGRDAPDRLSCPRCSASMTRNFYSAQYFLEVDRCYNCKVTWFDGGELEILQALVEEIMGAP